MPVTPFITNSYGLRETRCWITIDDCNNAYNIAFAYQLAINMLPSLFLTILSLSLIGVAVFVVTKKTIGKNLERHHRLAIKEIIPLSLYPYFVSNDRCGKNCSCPQWQVCL